MQAYRLRLAYTVQLLITTAQCMTANTRKLCYRKDDRAMLPMGALKIFGTP